MPENDLLKRLIDAGMTLTQATQAKAEELLRELAKATEAQAGSAQTAVDDLIERSRQNRERIFGSLRAELYEQADLIRDQIEHLGLATKDDINRLAGQIATALGVREAMARDTTGAGSSTTARPSSAVDAGSSAALVTSSARKAATKSSAKKASAKKASAKKAPAKKSPAKKASAAKAAAKKGPSAKAAAKKAPASKAAAKKAPASKASAKKGSGTSKASASKSPAEKASSPARASTPARKARASAPGAVSRATARRPSGAGRAPGGPSGTTPR
jgi:polyhydroxyalkanoate synthesis regulator phasin